MTCANCDHAKSWHRQVPWPNWPRWHPCEWPGYNRGPKCDCDHYAQEEPQ